MKGRRARLRLLAGTLFLLAAPALAARPDLAGGEALGVSLGRIVTALVICTVVALLAALVIRQRQGRQDLRSLIGGFRASGTTIQVLESRRLTPTADICLVRQGGEEFLILLGPGQARVLRRRACDRPAAGVENQG